MNTIQKTLINNSLQQELLGGRTQEWNNINQNKSQYVEHYKSTQNGAEKVKRTYEIKQPLDVERLNNPYLIHPEDYETQQELFEVIKHWWIFKYRKKESTIKDRIRYAQKMSEHPIFPVNWLKFNHVKIINYLEHREYVDYENKRGKYQIINEWKTIKTFAKVFGISADLWGYTPGQKHSDKIVLSEQKLNEYIEASKVNPLWHMIALFQIDGLLRSSEFSILKISNMDLGNQTFYLDDTRTGNNYIILSPRLVEAINNYLSCREPLSEYEDYLVILPDGTYKGKVPQPFGGFIKKQTKLIAQKAGITKYVAPYIIKPSSITCDFNKQVNPKIIQRKARHSKIETTLQYDHVSDDMVKKYFEKQR